jgi:hypothetical protein
VQKTFRRQSAYLFSLQFNTVENSFGKHDWAELLVHHTSRFRLQSSGIFNCETNLIYIWHPPWTILNTCKRCTDRKLTQLPVLVSNDILMVSLTLEPQEFWIYNGEIQSLLCRRQLSERWLAYYIYFVHCYLILNQKICAP